MIEMQGKWFYKAPGVKTIDFMSLVFEKKVDGPTELAMRIFITPPEGVNPKTDKEDWNLNYYGRMEKAPELRIRYEVPGRVGIE